MVTQLDGVKGVCGGGSRRQHAIALDVDTNRGRPADV
jgi:hypothetical protein